MRFSRWLALISVALVLIVLVVLLRPMLQRDWTLRAGYAALAEAERTSNQTQALEAASSFEAVLAFRSDDVQLRRSLARAYALADRHDDAIAQLEAAWRLRPDGTIAQRELALAYEQAGRFEEADTLWRTLGFRAEQLRAYAYSFEQAGRLNEAAEWRARAERQR